MAEQFVIEFLSAERPPQCPPNSKYPEGIDIDMGQRPACMVKLPYPAKCVGAWFVICTICGCKTGITAAGRPDDPRSAMIPCASRR